MIFAFFIFDGNKYEPGLTSQKYAVLEVFCFIVIFYSIQIYSGFVIKGHLIFFNSFLFIFKLYVILYGIMKVIPWWNYLIIYRTTPESCSYYAALIVFSVFCNLISCCSIFFGKRNKSRNASELNDISNNTDITSEFNLKTGFLVIIILSFLSTLPQFHMI